MKKNKFIADCAILCALTVVLQILSTLMTNYLQFSLTLALIPVAVACIKYGAKCGVIVSSAMGITLFVECAVGFDVGGGILFAVNPLLTFVASAGRVVLAGALLCLITGLTKRYEQKRWRNFLLSALLPAFNTSVFLACFVTMFNSTLYEWAGDTPVISYIFVGMVGINFVVEVITCTILCPAIIHSLNKLRR